MSDAPRRRANTQTAEKADIGATLKRLRVPIVIVILWAGIIGYNVASAEGVFGEPAGEDCRIDRVHWHSTFRVFVDGEQLRFDPARTPAFGDQTTSPGAGFHVHGNDGFLHFHPGAARCIELGDAFQKLGILLSDNDLQVSAAHGPHAGTYTDGAGGDLTVRAKAFGGSWKDVDDIDGFLGKMPADGTQILVSYGNATDAGTIEAQQTLVPGLAGTSYEPVDAKPSIVVPVIASSTFAILGLMLWRSFDKKMHK